jgi:membrane-associated protease RseP (regulator of RpoE activity)
MDRSYLSDPTATNIEIVSQPSVVFAEFDPGHERVECHPPIERRRRVWLPLLLFIATCVSTFLAGFLSPWWSGRTFREALLEGLTYSGAVMAVLVCHEMGHFVQAWRYGVYASWPYFIPMPLTPIGTFGAVIAMEGRRGDRRALFDIGISGPLAGLVPTMIFLLLGIQQSRYEWVPDFAPRFGNPLLLEWLAHWQLGPMPPHTDIILNPLLFAGWVGLLITSLNLLPVGQLDGGHILYGLLRWRANWIANIVLATAIGLSIWLWFWWWWPMLTLLTFVVGTRHPPTANDNMPLGWFRHVLGWLTLSILFLGFTPQPFIPQ